MSTEKICSVIAPIGAELAQIARGFYNNLASSGNPGMTKILFENVR